MRHQKRGNKLGRTASHRKAMLANMVTSLFIHKQIKTTEAKAKEARRLAERLITHAKKDTTHTRRLVFSILRNKAIIKVLFEEIAPVYANRNGGYTRLIKLGYRPNDTARVVLLQLVDFFTEETKKESKKSTAKKRTEKAPAKEAKAVKSEVESKKPAVAPAEEEPEEETVSEEETVIEETPETQEAEAEEEKAEESTEEEKK